MELPKPLGEFFQAKREGIEETDMDSEKAIFGRESEVILEAKMCLWIG